MCATIVFSRNNGNVQYTGRFEAWIVKHLQCLWSKRRTFIIIGFEYYLFLQKYQKSLILDTENSKKSASISEWNASGQHISECPETNGCNFTAICSGSERTGNFRNSGCLSNLSARRRKIILGNAGNGDRTARQFQTFRSYQYLSFGILRTLEQPHSWFESHLKFFNDK